MWPQIGRGKSGKARADPLWVPTGPSGLLKDRPSGPVANPGLPLGFVVVILKFVVSKRLISMRTGGSRPRAHEKSVLQL